MVGKLFLFLLQELVDLVGLDPLAHQFEVGVVFFAELLHEADILFLHVLEGLARHVHLAQQRVFLLKGFAGRSEIDKKRTGQKARECKRPGGAQTCLAMDSFLLRMSICSSTERIFLRASSSAIFLPSLLSLSSSSRSLCRSSSACNKEEMYCRITFNKRFFFL